MADYGACLGSKPKKKTDELAQTSALKPPNPKNHPKGHGRNPAAAYKNATVVPVAHDILKPGAPCPTECGGKLYSLDAGVVLRVNGGSLAEVVKYELEKLRCSLCGEVFTAKLPDGVTKDKYSPDFKASLAIQKYFMGVPLYRQEGYQAMLGMPLSDATQWMLTKQAAMSYYPVFQRLQYYAAQAPVTLGDDTRGKIMAITNANKNLPSSERKGVHTSCIIAQHNTYKIYLFMTGTKHCGTNAIELFNKRDPKLGPPIHMVDALAANMPDKLNAIYCNCLCHARRKFVELEPHFPEPCKVVIEAIAAVYHHEAVIKQRRLNAEARLRYHQQHSGPIMLKLHAWLDAQIQTAIVEPNSSLGKAINYMLKHWQRLTRFLQLANAPLDTNTVEAALKLPIRLRNSARVYKTEHGADIANCILSLICTCKENGINPHAYLTALESNKELVAANPDDFLPWSYQTTLAKHLNKAA